MTTKKKKHARAPRRNVAAELAAELGAKLELMHAAIGELALELQRERQRRSERTTIVTVLLIGEFLQQHSPLPRSSRRVTELEVDDALSGSPIDPELFERSPKPPDRLVRGYLAQSVIVRRAGDNAQPVQMWIDDPQRRLWARGAWLIALNGGILSSVRVGDRVAGGGMGSAPVCLLEHPIARGQQVGAAVSLELEP